MGRRGRDVLLGIPVSEAPLDVCAGYSWGARALCNATDDAPGGGVESRQASLWRFSPLTCTEESIPRLNLYLIEFQTEECLQSPHLLHFLQRFSVYTAAAHMLSILNL